MFFMGGMTLGYLHPPVRTKRGEGSAAVAEEDSTVAQRLPPTSGAGDGALERTLLWARRILC